MNPVLFSLGGLPIRYYGILIAAAFLIGYFILRKLGKERGLTEELIDNYFIWLVPFMIIGARIFEVLFYEPRYYFSNPAEILYIWHGGISSHGAILGAILATYFFTRKHKISFYKIADLAVIPCALGAVFVRIGNFINGEIVGKVTNSFFGVKFEGYDGLRHPVQLYEAFVNFVVFGLLLWIKKLKPRKGVLFWGFLLIYSVFRLALEFFKDAAIYFGLTTGQWFSVILMAFSFVFLYKIYSKKK